MLMTLLTETIQKTTEEGTFEHFDWGIHAITIPGVLLFGIFLGWSLRERKIAQDEARKAIAKERSAA